MKRFLQTMVVMFSVGVVFTACSGGGGGTSTSGNNGTGGNGSTTLSSISITPSSPTGTVGDSIPFAATGLLSNATSTEVTSSAVWSSSNTAVAAFSTVTGAKHIATLLSAGTTTITATSGSITASAVLTAVTGSGIVTTPNPLTVTPALDTARAVAGILTTTGGTITATAADGSVMTLVVPDGALLSTQTITVIPVASIAGLPMSGGLAAGVQMEPSGLAFYKPVSLTITPATSVPIANQVTYGYHEAGSEFHLEPPVVSGSAITLKLLRFSGGGLANGTPGDVAAQLLRTPSSAEDFISQSMYQLLSAERQNALLGVAGDPDFASKFQALLDAWETYVVKPRILNAASSCAAGREALSYALSLERQRQLMGFTDNSSWADGTITNLMSSVGTQCIQEAYTDCVSTGNVTKMIQAVLGLERQKQLLGMGGGVVEGGDLAEKCARWEIDFTSDMLWVSSGTTVNVEVQSLKIPYQWKFFTGTATKGTGPLNYIQSTYSDPEITLTGHGSTAGVMLEMNLNMRESIPPPSPDIQLVFDTGNPQPLETQTMCFPPSPCISIDGQAYWSAPWILAHQINIGSWFNDAIYGTLMLDWTLTNGYKQMKKTYTGIVPSAPDVLETTNVIINHKPLP